MDDEIPPSDLTLGAELGRGGLATVRHSSAKVPPRPLGSADPGSCASSGRAWRGFGRPVTDSGARASRLQSRRFHRL